MSCISRIEVIILDLDAFKKACSDLDLEFMEGQKEYHTDDGRQTCEHAVKMKDLIGGRELGLVRARFDDRSGRIVADKEAEGWTLMVDTFGGAGRIIMNRVGTKCETLLHKYGCHAVRSKATQMNWSLTEREYEDGIEFEVAPRAMLQEETEGSW